MADKSERKDGKCTDRPEMERDKAILIPPTDGRSFEGMDDVKMEDIVSAFWKFDLEKLRTLLLCRVASECEIMPSFGCRDVISSGKWGLKIAVSRSSRFDNVEPPSTNSVILTYSKLIFAFVKIPPNILELSIDDPEDPNPPAVGISGVGSLKVEVGETTAVSFPLPPDCPFS